jgi:hypothetical protein
MDLIRLLSMGAMTPCMPPIPTPLVAMSFITRALPEAPRGQPLDAPAWPRRAPGAGLQGALRALWDAEAGQKPLASLKGGFISRPSLGDGRGTEGKRPGGFGEVPP